MRQNGDPMLKPFAFAIGGASFWQNLSEWYQGSVFSEIFTYLEEKYFSVSFPGYENFSIGASTGTNVRNTILGLALGLIIACAMVAHTKNGLGRFVRRMLREDCTSPEQAKTILELGYFRNPSIRRELKRKVTLGKLVRCVEEDQWLASRSAEETEKQKEEDKPTEKPTFKDRILGKRNRDTFVIDFATAHFYIPEDLRYRADIRFEKKGSSWLFFALAMVLTVVAAALACIFAPDLFRLADNLITYFSS